MTPATLVADLRATRDETLEYYSLDVADLERRYAPGKWPVRFILHHLADSEMVLAERIRRTLSEESPVLSVFDPDQWAVGLAYEETPLALSRAVFESVRNATIHFVEHFYASRGERAFVHSVAGVRTLKQEMEKVAAHNAHHLEQIRQALNSAITA